MNQLLISIAPWDQIRIIEYMGNNPMGCNTFGKYPVNPWERGLQRFQFREMSTNRCATQGSCQKNVPPLVVRTLRP